jgi:putative transposase
MLKNILESALDAELDAHPDAAQQRQSKKWQHQQTIKTSDGTIEIETFRGRQLSFEPAIVRKRETILTEGLEKKIIGLYGLGMSLRDISEHISEMYDTDISATTLPAITDKVLPLVKERQQRPLGPLYCIVWLDAMFYKVREDGRAVTRCIYNILGINREGSKEVLGLICQIAKGRIFG